MPSLEQVLASVPGLAGYQATVNQNNQRGMQTLQMAQGAGGILAQIAAQARQERRAPMEDALLEAQVGEHRAKAAKLKMEADFNSKLMQAGGVDALNPDQLDAFAARAAMLNHPGAVGMARLAEVKRAKTDNQQMMGGLRSQIVADEPAATEAEAVARINAGGGRPMSIGVGENPNVIPRKEGGVTAYLMDSPYVGTAAKALQDRIDSGAIRDPKQVELWVKNLNDRHMAETSRVSASDRRQNQTIEIKNMFPPQARASASGGSAETTPGDFTKQGDDYLKSLPETDRQLVKKIANYEIDPKTLSIKGGHRERVLSMVSQFDSTYDDTQYANKRRAIAQFGSGPQGNTVRNLNVAIEHIDTLQRAADALKNGEFVPGNKVWNEVAKTFGKSPPNTFEGIRDFVANEVVKGTIGNAGALQDRVEAAAKVKASASPEQLNELMNGWTELMGGQVKGLAQQYQGSTGLKDFRERYLTPRTLEAIATAESKAVGGAQPDRRTQARPAGKRVVVDY